MNPDTELLQQKKQLVYLFTFRTKQSHVLMKKADTTWPFPEHVMSNGDLISCCAKGQEGSHTAAGGREEELGTCSATRCNT